MAVNMVDLRAIIPLRLIQEQVDFIANVQNSDQARRLAKAQQVGEALTECDRQIQILCRQLQVITSTLDIEREFGLTN